ncbi:50S ribosomal protein L4 [Gloeothece verrucosa]|uniref:Large ribosomal subunit protein uL4 n=1 Tax=Gloeothece verrucosa (strain PCC 7822) TaxID=497965 RepID=E0UJD2_GLOV7|nr:50S ribosomal protein L4 [Gloeothece verrucosa]ADN16950.1 ribosomal protein L4/L1e [Gloeothece verrucosa PCC 7822]
MVNCVVKNWDGDEVGQTPLELKVAKEETASHILHRAVVRQLANARQGTASTKTRSEVRGGGRKPWRQKGTGRARAGSNRSPLWRGGGVIFGPKPRDYNLKMNRKERRLALRTALNNQAENLIIVENFGEQFPQPKTRELASALARWGVTEKDKVLLILSEIPENVGLSARNICNVKVIKADSLNVYDLLTASKLVATSDALEKILEVYSG